MEGVKYNGQRRALRDIKNFIAAPAIYPSVGTKREFSHKNIISDQNSNKFGGGRPIARRFDAALANRSEQCPERSGINYERSHGEFASAATANEPISILIDEDDFGPADEQPLPMNEEMEEMVTCEPKEIEMEDIEEEEEHIPNIDSFDSKNPLAVVEYVEDIYNFYRQTEDSSCVSADYMSKQTDINEKMRAILIDWLVEVHYKFEFMDQTLFLTVNIIDRFLAQQAVVRKKLQLVGITAMLLACKYEEVSVPLLDDLIVISDHAYSRKEIIDMERLIVNTLHFNMSAPTPYVFMRRFLKAAEADKKVELLSFYLVELCLVDHEMLKFQPSMLAAAAVYTAQCTVLGFRNWTKTSELHTRLCENELEECCRMIVGLHHKAGVGKLTGVFRKYSTYKFGFAAKAEPAVFLLEMRQ